MRTGGRKVVFLLGAILGSLILEPAVAGHTSGENEDSGASASGGGGDDGYGTTQPPATETPATEPPATQPSAYNQPPSSGSSASSDDESDSMVSDLSAEGKEVNNPGMDATSKACRYDDGPGWSDCDPFELVKYRVLRLIHGGSQCEEVKNITKHCTPMDFPYGTHWLIVEHRKCIAELNRLKAMIADLHKFIVTLHEKGKELFSAYQKLKTKLEDLNRSLEKIKVEGEHQQEVLSKVKEDIEEWKSKARELQIQLDELKSKYHDLESEEHELLLKNEQLSNEINIITKENEGIKKKIDKLSRNNEELRKRIVESERIKEKVKLAQAEKNKLENKLEGLEDVLLNNKDLLTECRIQTVAKHIPEQVEGIESEDTHVDLSMEMYIVHNKTQLFKPTYKPVYYTTAKPYEKKSEETSSRCLISYYGYTNETCWYETDGERSEDAYVDALGHHLVEAHWKYFTIDVKDQSECDRASHLHYEFLLKRCSPKHYLPVLSIFKGMNNEAFELGTHIYPAVSPTSDKKRSCWITFLGAHGHCEAHNQEYDMYNTDDTPEGYAAGSGSDKEKCLDRAEWWMKFCQTPVVVTYVPDGVSTVWEEQWIMHDSHGGRMFEDSQGSTNQINPDSLQPHAANPSAYKSEYKSAEPKSPDYFDSPEYRKSLHLEGEEKEALLAQLRARLGIADGGQAPAAKDVKHYEPVIETSEEPAEEPQAAYTEPAPTTAKEEYTTPEPTTTYKEAEPEPETQPPQQEAYGTEPPPPTESYETEAPPATEPPTEPPTQSY